MEHFANFIKQRIDERDLERFGNHACQLAHWKKGHKEACGLVADWSVEEWNALRAAFVPPMPPLRPLAPLAAECVDECRRVSTNAALGSQGASGERHSESRTADPW